MNDLERLELAAKAAGYPHVCIPYGSCNLHAKMPDRTYHEGQGEYLTSWTYKEWNPLTDDGDALRLAVQLRIGIHWMNGRVCAYQDPAIDDQFESSREDAQSNTRRAIVRAAAEIGKAIVQKSSL